MYRIILSLLSFFGGHKSSPVRLYPKQMGGDISAHGRWQGRVFLAVIVNHDRTYEKTRSIMNALHGLYGGEIQYYEYWKSEGFVPHSQASLENIDENKVLEIIKED